MVPALVNGEWKLSGRFFPYQSMFWGDSPVRVRTLLDSSVAGCVYIFLLCVWVCRTEWFTDSMGQDA